MWVGIISLLFAKENKTITSMSNSVELTVGVAAIIRSSLKYWSKDQMSIYTYIYTNAQKKVSEFFFFYLVVLWFARQVLYHSELHFQPLFLFVYFSVWII
jgi:hypothetical protein